MDWTTTNFGISFILVFIEGVISFFSPCVIPLLPVYLSYLAGNHYYSEEIKTDNFQRKKVLIYTLFFITGIYFAFFILGMSFTSLGTFFKNHQLFFTKVGGIIIILLGLFQMGLYNIEFLQRERKYNINLFNKKVTPLTALIMGFTFSFAWTPCVGPALSSVLIMASSSTDTLLGNMLILTYAAGFIIPFLILGFFTSQALSFIRRNPKLLKYTVKIGGIILIIMGIMTFAGWLNGASRYFNPTTPPDNLKDSQVSEKTQIQQNKLAIDFTLYDQYGNRHILSDYKGKVVFLNFWTTWCPPCNMEMPDIEALYIEYNKNQEQVVFLGVANPQSQDYPNNFDIEKNKIIAFLKENNYTFPTVFDETGDILRKYQISAFPTTFIIDKKGSIYGYAPGMLTKARMKDIIHQGINSTE